jgi:hypothetical protein
MVHRYLLLVLVSVFALSGCNTVSNVSKKDSDDSALLRIGTSRYDIMGKGVISERVMLRYLLSYNKKISPKKAAYVVRTYVWEANYEGVNHDVAFAQMCLETNFLRFGGTATLCQNNFCGLGTINDSTVGFFFPSIRMGIRAHIQHLKAYAVSKNLVNRCVDPRFALIKRSSAKNIFELSGKWATDPSYGNSIKKRIDLMLDMENELRQHTS